MKGWRRPVHQSAFRDIKLMGFGAKPRHLEFWIPVVAQFIMMKTCLHFHSSPIYDFSRVFQLYHIQVVTKSGCGPKFESYLLGFSMLYMYVTVDFNRMCSLLLMVFIQLDYKFFFKLSWVRRLKTFQSIAICLPLPIHGLSPIQSPVTMKLGEKAGKRSGNGISESIGDQRLNRKKPFLRRT